MAWPLLLNPVTGEALLYSAAATGSALAAAGLIDNKDEAELAVKDLGNRIKRGTENAVTRLSTYMSPVGSTEIEVSPDYVNLGIIAIPDALRVAPPMLAAAKPKAGSKPKSGTKPKAEPKAAGASAPSPQNNNNDKDSTNRALKIVRELKPFSGYKGGSYVGNTARVLRDAAYAGGAADLGLNLYETALDPDYEWQWGISNFTMFPEKGAFNLLRGLHNRKQLPKPPAVVEQAEGNPPKQIVEVVDTLPGNYGLIF